LLVGDLIQDIREAITDQPQVLPAPTAVITAAVVAAAASTLPVGAYFLTYTFRTPWGETLPGGESGVLNVGGAQGIQVTAPAIPPSASVIRVYFTLAGGAAGSEQQFLESAILPFTIAAPGSTAVVPTRNSAYLPDTDGDAINASSMFRWINRALELASQVCGGLLDYSGLGTLSGVPQYITPGQWKRISSLWYDGYPLGMDDAGNYFRRNAITASILSSVATSLLTDRMMLEVYPQPSRTAAATTLANPLAATDTQAVLTSSAGFLLTNGFAQIGNEIVSYSGISANTLKNLVRGLSGTVVAAALAGTAVNELNLFWQGWRMYAPAFQPGQSNLSLPIPVGWGSLLFKYGLGRAKMAEQNTGDYTKLEDDFIKKLSDWYRTNKVTTGPRQIGEQQNTLETLPNMGGGWVIPAVFPITYVLQECYTPLLEGGLWQQFTSIACVTLEAAMCAMLVKQIIRRNVGLRTTLNQCWSTVERKLNGSWNCALSVLGRNFTCLKPATKQPGESERDSGSRTTAASENYSTLVLEEKLFHRERKKATALKASVCAGDQDLQKFWRKCLNLLKAITSQRVPNRKSEKRIESSSPTLKNENSIVKPLKIGGLTSLLKSEQSVWKGLLKGVGIGWQK
jgi:hypothetical protein